MSKILEGRFSEFEQFPATMADIGANPGGPVDHICRITGTLALMLAMAIHPTATSAANMQFQSTASTSCGIVVTRNGLLRTNANARVLTSGGSGGQHGLASVTANSNAFRLYVDQPTDFTTRPVADTAPEQDFRARIRSNGATTFNWTRNDRALNVGTSNVRVQFRARKFAGNSFANGNYAATVVIRCE